MQREMSAEDGLALYLAALGGDAWLAAQLEALGVSDRHESVADAREVRRVLEAVAGVARRHGRPGLDALAEALAELESPEGEVGADEGEREELG